MGYDRGQDRGSLYRQADYESLAFDIAETRGLRRPAGLVQWLPWHRQQLRL